MTTSEYLKKVLDSQALKSESAELKALDAHHKTVEALITKAFPDANPAVTPGGSRAKGTMIKESYDLDLTCYFPREDSDPGDSLKEIYANVKKALEPDYFVHSKRSSLRLKGKELASLRQDFHVDVVPGRYVDGDSGDVYLHQTEGEKKWLKTNLQVHIDHVKGSGVRDAIRLMKLWRTRNAVDFKTFVLELAVIKLLAERKSESLEKQLLHVWTALRDDVEDLVVVDPANSGNDLTPLLDAVRTHVSGIARSTLDAIEWQGWEAVFGSVEKNETQKAPAIVRAAAAVSNPTRPYSSRQ